MDEKKSGNTKPTDSSGSFVQFQVYTEKEGVQNKKSYRLHSDRAIIGSAHSCDIRIQENAVSNVHAVLEKNAQGQIQVYDLASETGVYVNGKKVTSKTLKDSDEVQIGFTKIMFSKQTKTTVPNISLPKSMLQSGSQKLYFSEEEDFSSILLEDEREVIEIFNHNQNKKALQVAMYWGSTILDVQHHVDKKSIFLGQNKKADLLIPSIPNLFPFIVSEHGDYVLHLTNSMKGVIRSGNTLQSIESLKEKLQGSPSGLYRTIKKNDLIKLQIEDFTIFINFSPAPPKLNTRINPQKDPIFFRSWLISLTLTTAIIFAALNTKSPEPLAIEELPPRITSIIFKPPPPPVPKILRQKTKLPTKVKKAPKPPKKRKVVKKTRTTPRKTPIKKKPKVAPRQKPKPSIARQSSKSPLPTKKLPAKIKSVKRPGGEGEDRGKKGKLGSVGRGKAQKAARGSTQKTRVGGRAQAKTRGAGGRGNTQTLFKDLGARISKSISGGSKGVNQASKGLRSYEGFSDVGGKGFGAIGSGTGSHGKSMDVGNLGTKNIGRGRSGTGRGSIASGGHLIGGRARPSITVGTETETIILGGLSKDVIDEIILRYLNQIRYCYEKELTGNRRKIRGRVMTQFLIKASGRVSNAAVRSTSLRNANVERCLIGVLKSIKFPMPLGGGVVEVKYPFSFTPSAN